MALTLSTMLDLNTKIADFTLLNTIDNKPLSLVDACGKKATVVMFICNHCPFVKFINKAIVDVANKYTPKNIAFIAISANDVENYPEDHPDKMKEAAAELHYPFPYLYDESQAVAKAFKAACTPDFFVLDRDLRLIYRGKFDEATPSNSITPTGETLSFTLDQLLADRPIDQNQKPSMGCNIKWKN